MSYTLTLKGFAQDLKRRKTSPFGNISMMDMPRMRRSIYEVDNTTTAKLIFFQPGC